MHIVNEFDDLMPTISIWASHFVFYANQALQILFYRHYTSV